ncbi:MAG: BrnA antitoxin family protein [Mariprofundaceae bacterium]|nr:BrnA antitoxin family protein [Mariprofundaceae bacterium]
MSKPYKKTPEFKDKAAERAFWESHDSSEYMDWNQAKKVIFAKLKPSTKPISLRMPESMLERIKVEANKRDVPYQSLIKIWLSEKLDRAA